MITYHSIDHVPQLQERTCVALGLFDGLHLGHRSVIAAAVETAAGEGLSPAVFTFSIGRSHPVAKPDTGRLLSPAMREALLAELGVSLLLYPPFEEFQSLTPVEFVSRVLRDTLRCAHVFCGENFHFGRAAAGSVDTLRELCEPLGIQVHALPLVLADGGAVSSTRIRELVAAGDMPGAQRLLGRPFAVDFAVVHGRRLGRTLGTPTINQPLPPWFAVPRFGVYASHATVGGTRHVAVTNVGVKPTVGSNGPLAETYIHGFEGDLYGKEILVEFLRFMRPERKFDSVEALREQIHRDSATADEIGRLYP